MSSQMKTTVEVCHDRLTPVITHCALSVCGGILSLSEA